MSIVIDKEFESLIPPLTDEEFAQLEENCVRDGIREPLVMWKQDNGDSILIDGHNRFRIIAKHMLPYTERWMQFKDRDEAKLWIINNQLGRRNLPVIDRGALLEAKQKIVAKQAEERMKAGVKADPSEKFPKGTGTREVIGKELGVSGKTYDKIRAINQKATDRTKQLVREGKLSINQAYNSVHPKRPDLVKEAIKEHEAFQDLKKEKVIDFEAVKADKANLQIIQTKVLEDVLKVLNSVDSFGITYKQEDIAGISKLVNDDERHLILERCSHCKSIIQIIQLAFA